MKIYIALIIILLGCIVDYFLSRIEIEESRKTIKKGTRLFFYTSPKQKLAMLGFFTNFTCTSLVLLKISNNAEFSKQVSFIGSFIVFALYPCLVLRWYNRVEKKLITANLAEPPIENIDPLTLDQILM